MEKVRIQDDLYNFVNGEWIENAVIPNDRPTCGGFSELDKGVEQLMIDDLSKMIKENKYPNKHLERACKLIEKAKDVKKRNKAGIKPALKYLKFYEKIKNISCFNRYLKDFVLKGYTLPFSLQIETDMKDTSRKIVYIGGPSIILPDTTYYLEPMAQQKAALLNMWSNMTKAILAQTNLSVGEQEKYLEDTLKFDAIIATLIKSKEENSDYTKLYNIVTTRKVSSALKPIKFKKLLNNLFGIEINVISNSDPRFLKGFKTLFNEENFEMFKHWSYVSTLLSTTSVLSEELRELGSSYRRALYGIQTISSIDKYSYNMANQFYSEPLGMYYGDKYFGQEAKKDVVDLVHNIIDAYKSRIVNNNFLAKETKEKAILKLSTMVVKMGYPDKADEIYDQLVFDEKDSYFNIIRTLKEIETKYYLEELKKPTNRERWAMPGNMVNACYNPFSNDITFPAAILQAPFYSIKQTRSENLGGIGAVIGHEISHAFDNNGAQFDENGNLKNWWTKEDFKNFKKKTQAMIKEFDGITLPWGEVNSKLIVSENIADNGGVAVTLEIMSKMKDASYEEYFINWAKVWCQKAKPEYQQMLLKVDVHGPAILRANMTPRNFDEWYKTFKVTKKDKMYIAPSKRVVIW